MNKIKSPLCVIIATLEMNTQNTGNTSSHCAVSMSQQAQQQRDVCYYLQPIVEWYQSDSFEKLLLYVFQQQISLHLFAANFIISDCVVIKQPFAISLSNKLCYFNKFNFRMLEQVYRFRISVKWCKGSTCTAAYIFLESATRKSLNRHRDHLSNTWSFCKTKEYTKKCKVVRWSCRRFSFHDHEIH